MVLVHNPAHRMLVGDRSHRVVEAYLRSVNTNGIDTASFTLLLTRCARDVLTTYPVNTRKRETLVDVVTAAGVYLRRLAPISDWRFVANTPGGAAGQFDLTFEHPDHGVVIDELKLGVDRVDEAAVQDQLARYHDAGLRLWGSRFVGVRACSVYQPARSRFYPAGGDGWVSLTDVAIDGLMLR